MPRIQGRFLPGVHRHALVFRLIFQLLEPKDAIFTQTIGTQKWYVPYSTSIIPTRGLYQAEITGKEVLTRFAAEFFSDLLALFLKTC